MDKLKKGSMPSGLVAVFFLFFIVAFSGPQASLVNAEPVPVIDKTIEAAVLSEDWKKVNTLLDKVDTQTEDPVLRLIKGHACLALNRNNESLCLFLSASSDNDLEKWGEWNQDFTKINSSKAITHYLRGDALARLVEWDAALLAFNKALEINPKSAMILNARGTVFAKKELFNNAITDFTKATMLKQDLADAYSNLGALAIQQMEGAKGALDDFNTALKITPDFAIAFYGRGCIYTLLRDFDSAESDFIASISKNAYISKIVCDNIEQYRETISKQSNLVAKTDETNPGMNIDSQIERLKKNDFGFRGKQFKKDLEAVIGSGDKKLVA